MAKRVDPAKAKAAKQKKIAIGLVVLLVAVLAIQGPKMLNMLKGSKPAAVTATGPGGPAGGPAPGGPAVGGPAVGGPPWFPARPPLPRRLISRPSRTPTRRRSSTRANSRPSSASPARTRSPSRPSPSWRRRRTKPPTTDPAADPTEVHPTTALPPPLPRTAASRRAAARPSSVATLATATSISVNGAAEDVTEDVPFPVAEPTFVLVSVAKDGKSVEIGVDGGEYASGGETLKLLLGKKLTLQNTADGSRYELELLSIKGFPLPRQKG